MDLDAIGIRIKKARRAAKLTQEQLAELADVSPHYIYEIERGSKAMSIQTLERISLHLHQSVDYLFWGGRLPYAESGAVPKDRLTLLTDPLPPHQRDAVADVLSALIPYLK